MKRVSYLKLLTALLPVLVLAGCASGGNLSIADQTQQTVATKLVPGRSTQADVRQAFGDPAKSTFTDSGNEVWEYDYDKTHAKVQNFIPVVSAFTHGTTGTKKTLVVFFDKNGILKNFRMSSSAIDTHAGVFQ